MDKPYGVPADFAEHFKLMTDMMIVAFQADLTRVVTFLVTREGTSRAYREIGIPDGHHPLTHHQQQPELMEKVAQINDYHVQQFARLVGEDEVDQGRRSEPARQFDDRLRRGLSDGNRHLHEDLPTLIAGRGGNYIKTGPPHRVPQGDADVQSVPDDDGPHGPCNGTFRRRHGQARRLGSELAGILTGRSTRLRQTSKRI